jgi:aryl-alcohol dehydrogenase-like predicted oxidoreductase
MEKRTLGNTGLQLSIMGYGGFHLIEIPRREASHLLNTYLDRGGNYIETAAQYGDGISERKIGEAVSHRRDEYVLATKTVDRTREGAMRSLERSLRNLRTDHVDLFFMHEPQTIEEAQSILAAGGAAEAFDEAKKAGKARFLAISGHGRPAGIRYSIENHPYDVLMTGFNYFDRFNYPQIEGELLPLCLEKGVGVLGMKALADGYLHSNVESAIRYALSLPITALVLGMNRPEHLEMDLAVVESFRPMTEQEKEELYRSAPELGRYVCRQCGKCHDGDGLAPDELFLLEGLFDRQMDDYTVPAAREFALRERLKHWFGQSDWARREYARLVQKVDPERDYSALNVLCPYGIDIDRKLRITHSKLAADGYLF